MSSNDADPISPLRTPVVHITTHNASGKAIVHSSNDKPLAPYSDMRISHKLVYTSNGLPMDLNDEADIKAHKEAEESGNLRIVKKGGTICRIVDFAPGNKSMMHRTQSLDFGVVLSGQIVMELDDGSKTLMKEGDVAVQRGTMHTWKNPSETEWARLMFVLQDSKPLEIGGLRLKEDVSAGHGVFPSSGNDA
ncbi:hypothetical protein RBB50_009985 [Rhinocladiella similis]